MQMRVMCGQSAPTTISALTASPRLGVARSMQNTTFWRAAVLGLAACHCQQLGVSQRAAAHVYARPHCQLYSKRGGTCRTRGLYQGEKREGQGRFFFGWIVGIFITTQ